MGVQGSKDRAMGSDLLMQSRSTTLRDRGAHTNPPPPPTHILDLPTECLIEVIRRVGTPPLPIRRRHVAYTSAARRDNNQPIKVEHSLHCALVCKRWRAVADCAVSSLSLRDVRLTEDLARHLAGRFGRHLSGLAIAPLHAGTGDTLLVLADLTPQLESLELPFGYESSLPAVVELLTRWTRLRRVDLGNRLCSRYSTGALDTTFHALSNLPSLQNLKFRYDNDDLPEICEVICTLTALTTLQLECRHLPTPSVGHLPQILRALNLHDYEGDQLPDSLDNFTTLEALSINSAEHLSSLPDAVTRLSRLTKLEVVTCPQLTSLPSTLGLLTNLKICQIRDCLALQWPDRLGNLQALETLVMTRCGHLPRSLGHLPSLLYLRVDNFERLPQDIGNLPRLRTLELGYGSGVSGLPSSIGNLRTLQVLRIQFCFALVLLPPSLGSLTALRELDILNCGNKLASLPDSLSQLTALQVCKISGLGSLHGLPHGFSEWQRLVKLEVSWCNSLKELPEELGLLGSLKELEISGCLSLSTLPESLGSLTSLQVLRVRACPRLTMLPETIEELPDLRVLQVWDCDKLEPLPQSLRRICQQFEADLRL